MLFYMVNMCSLIIYGFFEKRANDAGMLIDNAFKTNIFNKKYLSRKKIIAFIIFLQFGLMLCLRKDTVGGDLGNYLKHFNWMLEMPLEGVFSYSADVGYYLLNWFVGLFTDNFNIFMAIIGVITFSFVFKFIYDESKSVSFSFFCLLGFGYLEFMFSGLRQAAAIAIVLYASRYIHQSKPLKFYLLIILAITFHSTAVFCLPMYLLKKVKISPTFLIVMPIISVCTFLFAKPFIQFALGYYSADYSSNIVIGQGYSVLIMLILFLVFSLFFYKQTVLYNKNLELYYVFLSVAILLQIISTQFSLFTRITIYYSLFSVILLPNVIYYIKDIKTRLLAKSGVYCFFIYFEAITLLTDSSSIIPYQFFWQ